MTTNEPSVMSGADAAAATITAAEAETKADTNCICIECGDKIVMSNNWLSSMLFSFNNKKNKYVSCYKCTKLLCPICANKYPLVPYDKTQPDTNNITKNTIVQSFCKVCFQNTSTIDYTRTYDIIEPPLSSENDNPDNNNSTTKPTTLLMVHGGGGSRMMFYKHAKILATKYNYRCILIDLPGHGNLVDMPLTLDTCVNVVQDIYSKECTTTSTGGSGRTIYVGASLGAYIGFYILHKMNSNCFIGSILLDCGQNVGPNSSLIAKIGCIVLKYVVTTMSSKQIMETMINITCKSKVDYSLIETIYGSGMFFQQGIQQVQCLQSIQPSIYIPTYTFPILFMNGSKDHRDSENKWLQLCTNQSLSQLHVYPDGDHFFTHDSRFISDINERIHTFIESIN